MTSSSADTRLIEHEPLSLHSKHTSVHQNLLVKLHTSLLSLSSDTGPSQSSLCVPLFTLKLSQALYSVAPRIATVASSAEHTAADIRFLAIAQNGSSSHEAFIQALQLTILDHLEHLLDKAVLVSSIFRKLSRDTFNLTTSENTSRRELQRTEPALAHKQRSVAGKISSVREGLAKTNEELSRVNTFLKCVETEEKKVENNLFNAKCAQAASYPLRAVGVKPFDENVSSATSQLRNAHTSATLASQESARLIEQRMIFKQELHSLKATYSLREDQAKQCREKVQRSVGDVIELRQISDVFKGMAAVWKSLAFAISNIRRVFRVNIQSSSIEKEDLSHLVESSHTVSVLTRVFSFDHIEARNKIVNEVLLHSPPENMTLRPS